MTQAIETLLKLAIHEDAPNGDITVYTLFDDAKPVTAKLLAKDSGIFFGHDIITTCFRLFSPTATLNLLYQDGDSITSGSTICTIEAPLDSLLLIERTMLNLCQRLSGIASLTARYVHALNNASISICDTRKTTPGLRWLEKQAVVAGGGKNHRFGLSDMILIKENHLNAMKIAGTLPKLPSLIKQAKSNATDLLAEIEIETLAQLTDFDLSDFDFIMLDNFNLQALPDAICTCRRLYPHIQLEVSGNVTLKTISQYSSFDIDRISIGALTHSVPAFDFSLLID